ncbi:MAG TPA: hypothetical protein VKS60_03705 [Stellaceae bacterium]|nr:hypothetical protein [Stellaceae bacterium]
MDIEIREFAELPLGSWFQFGLDGLKAVALKVTPPDTVRPGVGGAVIVFELPPSSSAPRYIEDNAESFGLVMHLKSATLRPAPDLESLAFEGPPELGHVVLGRDQTIIVAEYEDGVCPFDVATGQPADFPDRFIIATSWRLDDTSLPEGPAFLEYGDGA